MERRESACSYHPRAWEQFRAARGFRRGYMNKIRFTTTGIVPANHLTNALGGQIQVLMLRAPLRAAAAAYTAQVKLEALAINTGLKRHPPLPAPEVAPTSRIGVQVSSDGACSGN